MDETIDMLTPEEAIAGALAHAREVLGYGTATARWAIPSTLPGTWVVLVLAGADAGPAELEYGVAVGSVGGNMRVVQEDIDKTSYFQGRHKCLKRAHWAHHLAPPRKPDDPLDVLRVGTALVGPAAVQPPPVRGPRRPGPRPLLAAVGAVADAMGVAAAAQVRPR